MSTLSSVINNIFEHVGNGRYVYNSSGVGNNNIKYMEIPINEDRVEIPLFALKCFVDTFCEQEPFPSKFVASLCFHGNTSTYKSLDAIMKNVLWEDFENARLVKLDISRLRKTYYGSYGSIFDEDFIPLMLCLWRLKKKETDTGWIWDFDKPIIRLDPSLYTETPNSLTRYLTGKLCTTYLKKAFNSPMMFRDGLKLFSSIRKHYIQPQVIIDKIPFSLKEVCTPSISTTNECLLELASNYIDEIVYDHQ